MTQQINFERDIKVIFIPDYIYKALKQNQTCLMAIADGLNSLDIIKYNNPIKDYLSLQDKQYFFAVNVLFNKMLTSTDNPNRYENLTWYNSDLIKNNIVMEYLMEILFNNNETACDSQTLKDVLTVKNNMRTFNDGECLLNSTVINNVIFVILPSNVVSFMSLNSYKFKHNVYKMLIDVMMRGFEEEVLMKSNLYSQLVYGLIK